MSNDISRSKFPRLLIVDDDTLISEVLKQIARRGGYHVQCVHDGNQILSQVAAFNPHVIFLDLVMPGLDGVEVIELLAESRCKAKIVLMSGMDKRAITMVGNVVKENQLELLGTLSKPPNDEAVNAILIPLAKEIEARSHEIAKPSKPDKSGLQISINPCRGLAESGNDSGQELTWSAINLVWVLDSGEEMLIEDALSGHVRNGSARGILGSLLSKVSELRAQEANDTQKFGYYISIPAALLGEAEFPDYLAKTAAALNISPSTIMLEIDESVILGETESKNNTLARIKIKGFSIAVSVRKHAEELLASVNKLAIDELTIDMSYELTRKEALENIEIEYQCSSLATVARKAGVKTGAKNVHTKQQLEFITRCKFDNARGRYIRAANND